jgi:hypothetical protein
LWHELASLAPASLSLALCLTYSGTASYRRRPLMRRFTASYSSPSVAPKEPALLFFSLFEHSAAKGCEWPLTASRT